MSYTTRIAWEALRFVDGTALTGSYQTLGGPLLNPSYICKIVNNSTALVTVSINGTTDIDVVPGNSFWLYDEGKGSDAYKIALPQGTQFYIKGTAAPVIPGVSQNIYLVTQYILAQ